MEGGRKRGMEGWMEGGREEGRKKWRREEGVLVRIFGSRSYVDEIECFHVKCLCFDSEWIRNGYRSNNSNLKEEGEREMNEPTLN